MKKEKTITNDADENPKAKYILEELLEDINEKIYMPKSILANPSAKKLLISRFKN